MSNIICHINFCMPRSNMEDAQTEEAETTLDELKGQVFHTVKPDENGVNLLHRYRY